MEEWTRDPLAVRRRGRVGRASSRGRRRRRGRRAGHGGRRAEEGRAQGIGVVGGFGSAEGKRAGGREDPAEGTRAGRGAPRFLAGDSAPTRPRPGAERVHAGRWRGSAGSAGSECCGCECRESSPPSAESTETDLGGPEGLLLDCGPAGASTG